MVDKPSSLEISEPAVPLVKTRGDTLFDRWVYGGLNGVGTFLVTLPLAYWGDYGGGRKAFDGFSKFLTNSLKIGEKSAATVVRTTTLGLGGTLMVLPVRMAEHFRAPIVGWLNERYGSEADKAAEPQPQEPQTWASLIKGRLVAWGVVFGSFKAVQGMGFGQNLERFEHQFAEKVICNPLKMDTHTALGAETKAFRYGKLAALDVFATAAATMLLYAGSRFFAKQRPPEKQEALKARMARGRTHADALDDAAALPTMPDAGMPETKVTGEKHHPGMVAAHAPVQGLGA